MITRIVVVLMGLSTLVGCATNSGTTSSGGRSVDCSRIYAEPMLVGGVAGWAVAALVGAKDAPLILVGIAAGFLAGDTACERLKQAAHSRDELRVITKNIKSQKETISNNNSMLVRELEYLAWMVAGRKNELRSRVANVRGKAEMEIAALLRAEQDAEMIAAGARNPAVARELHGLAAAARDSRYQIQYAQNQLNRVAA